jgi:hypothetical protein
MDFNYIEKNIILKYWKTLIRKNINNISVNKFIKKPYLENYIITLSGFNNNNILSRKILDLIDSNEITNEELFLYVYFNIELNNEQKKNIELFFLNNEEINNDKNEDISEFFISIITYVIKYFKFYETVTELLFEKNDEDNELYNFILLFVKNKKNEINLYLKKNVKFRIFYYYIDDLLDSYETMFNFLIKFELINNCEKKDILHLFLKNLFTPWYEIYKKDILENNVNEKIKKYAIKNNFLSRILCSNNI